MRPIRDFIGSISSLGTKDQQIDDLAAADGTPDSPAEELQMAELAKLPGSGCAAKADPVYAHIGTADAARDLDLARALVKDETLSYLGKSYGTMLGATYAELFPDRVGRMVLDGVLPASLDMVEVTKGQAEGFEVAVRDFARDCLTHSECPLTGSVDEAVVQLQDWFASLDANPLPGRGGEDRELNEPLGSYAVLANLYAPSFQYAPLRSALRPVYLQNFIGAPPDPRPRRAGASDQARGARPQWRHRRERRDREGMTSMSTPASASTALSRLSR